MAVPSHLGHDLDEALSAALCLPHGGKCPQAQYYATGSMAPSSPGAASAATEASLAPSGSSSAAAPSDPEHDAWHITHDDLGFFKYSAEQDGEVPGASSWEQMMDKDVPHQIKYQSWRRTLPVSAAPCWLGRGTPAGSRSKGTGPLPPQRSDAHRQCWSCPHANHASEGRGITSHAPLRTRPAPLLLLQNGKTEYKSITYSPDATAQEFSDLYFDDDFRPTWVRLQQSRAEQGGREAAASPQLRREHAQPVGAFGDALHMRCMGRVPRPALCICQSWM